MFQPEGEGDLESVEEEVDELELATAADLLDLTDGPPPAHHLHNEIGAEVYFTHFYTSYITTRTTTSVLNCNFRMLARVVSVHCASNLR